MHCLTQTGRLVRSIEHISQILPRYALSLQKIIVSRRLHLQIVVRIREHPCASFFYVSTNPSIMRAYDLCMIYAEANMKFTTKLP